jgi:hypothetical protein
MEFGLRSAFPALVAVLLPSILAMAVLLARSRREVASARGGEEAPPAGL